MAYALDLRQRIVDAVDRSAGTKREIAALINIHESFIDKLLRQKRERGDSAPLPHGGGAAAKLTEERLATLYELVAQTPEAKLDELAQQCFRKTRVAVSESTVCRVLK
jgi:transposase